MSNFYQTLLECINSGQPLAYAMVVKTRGSTPQKAGAKAIFLTDGRVLGTIGGGCLEAESRRRAMDCLRDGRPRFFELNLNDDFGWDDGLICGGTAEVFIDPNVAKAREVFKALLTTQTSRERGSLVTVVKSPDDELSGSYHLVSGSEVLSSSPVSPEIEASLRNISSKCLDKQDEIFARIPAELEAEHAAISDEKTSGEAWSVYAEPILPKPVLFIAGAGHIGAALCRIGAWIGFDVVVIDDRGSYANAERLPDATSIMVEDPPKAAREFPITPDTYIVIVTRGHRNDAATLRECVNSNAAYIGMIGSRRKVKMIFDGLIEEGYCSRERLQEIHSPIGLNIGAETVEEIAASIAAELIQVRHMRRQGGAGGDSGRSLSEKQI